MVHAACVSLPVPQVRQYKTYVAREILHHASLRHPFIISLNEVVLTPRVSRAGCGLEFGVPAGGEGWPGKG